MNLSHNGTLSTTNVVWKNLSNAIKTSTITFNEIENQLIDYYNDEFRLIQTLNAKFSKIRKEL